MSDTTIRVNCPECGTQELRPTAFHLTIFDSGENHYLEFFCPSCTDLVRRDAEMEVAIMLVKVGVRSTEFHVPLEFLEPKSGPPISWDDVMDFHIEMTRRSAGASPEDSTPDIFADALDQIPERELLPAAEMDPALAAQRRRFPWKPPV